MKFEFGMNYSDFVDEMFANALAATNILHSFWSAAFLLFC